MERIRIGNDLQILWGIYAGEGVDVTPYDLSNRNLSVYVKTGSKRWKVSDFTTDGHIVKWLFYGKDQKILGTYSLELIENEGLVDMHTVDECKAFALVKCSCATGGDEESRVSIVTLEMTSRISVGAPTTEIAVDDSLSTTSTNPVQNRVITEAIYAKQDELHSGVNIKTINGQSILGQGNIDISGTASTDGSVVSADTHYEFPNVGSVNKIYIATKENKTYRFNPSSLIYEVIGSDIQDIEVIDGGDANFNN